MSDARQELEQEFLKLPRLKNVGLALMDYAATRYLNNGIGKDELGVFGVGPICFAFADWKEMFSICIIGVSAEAIREAAPPILQPEKLQEMDLKDNEAGFACFVVRSTVFLGQAVIYIEYALRAGMKGNLPFPESTSLN